MSKKEVSKKNNRLCTLLTVIGIVSMVSIGFSKNVFTTLFILTLTLAVILLIEKNMDDVENRWLNKNNQNI